MIAGIWCYFLVLAGAPGKLERGLTGFCGAVRFDWSLGSLVFRRLWTLGPWTLDNRFLTPDL